jgi:uncharacterized tellurite resistance protein B-like protein
MIEAIARFFSQRLSRDASDPKGGEEHRLLLATAALLVKVITSLVNRHYGAGEKIRIIETIWQVAYADGVISARREATCGARRGSRAPRPPRPSPSPARTAARPW